MPNIVTVKKPTIIQNTIICEFIINSITYSNTYQFPEDIPSHMADSRITYWLALSTSLGMFSIDYFDIVNCNFPLTKEEVTFFEKLFYFGLGEFRYVNNLDIARKTKVIPKSIINLTKNVESSNTSSRLVRPLLLNGGGKDGSASAYLLTKQNIDFTWFQRGDSKAQKNVTNQWNNAVFVVKRVLDERRKNGKYIGHRPMSAGIAMLSLYTAEAFHYSHVIASNESSANEGNMIIDNFGLNHQYSKSLEFENDLRKLIMMHGIEVNYFSLLRPLHELQIGIIVSKLSVDQLQAITSCNLGTSTGTWCMACAKCAFVVLIVTSINPAISKIMFGSTDIVNSPELVTYIRELVDPLCKKPLECVGTLEESQVALTLLSRHTDLHISNELENLIAAYSANPETVARTMHNFSYDLIPSEFENVKKEMLKLVKLYK